MTISLELFIQDRCSIIRRDPTPFFKAVKELEKEGLITAKKFKIIFYGDKNFIEKIAQESNIEPFIEIKGYRFKRGVLKSHTEMQVLYYSLSMKSNDKSLSALPHDR